MNLSWAIKAEDRMFAPAKAFSKKYKEENHLELSKLQMQHFAK